MTSFKHRRVDDEFIRECETLVRGGYSCVLLGPRFGGKGLVQERVRARLAGGADPVIALTIVDNDRPEALDCVRYEVSGGESNRRIEIGDPMAAVEALGARSDRPVFLFAANVDSLPHDAARAFLRRVRAAVESRRVVTILSGELDLRDLVYGVHSEFNCAEQFVLHGFGPDLHEELFRQHSEGAGTTWHDARAAAARAFTWTNGNVQISRLLIAVAEDLRRQTGAAAADMTDTVLERALRLELRPGAYAVGVLREALDITAADADCLHDVEALLSTGHVYARTLDGAPGILELAGVGVRSESRIEFASEFMSRLAKAHFTTRRIADLYAQSGRWHEAFIRYAQLEPAACKRPSDTDDRRTLNMLVQALTSSMFAAASEGSSKVVDLLRNGATYLLGFDEVSRWIRHHTWKPLEGEAALPPQASAALAAALPSMITESGVVPLPEHVGRFAVVAALRHGPTAVVLSGFGDRQVLSRERRALAVRLLESFTQAHDHAVRAEFNAARRELRDKQVTIFHQIFDFLDRWVFDVHQILELTGNELLRLGYRRVMFSLVDAQRQHIVGVLDCPTTSSVKLAGITHYPLSERPIDIQQYVVQTGRALIVESAADERLVNPGRRRAANLEAFAVVPILDRLDVPLGTIHIERTDGKAPSPSEVDDLELFGKQLARILALNDRMTLIQKCLDGSADPLMITNPNAEVVYANRAAAALFDVDGGWHDLAQGLFPAGTLVGDAVREALAGHRVVRQVHGFGRDKSYRGEVVCDTLRDWRSQTIGASIDVHDLRATVKIIDALTKIGPAPSVNAAIEAIMDAFASFGYPQVRMYVIDGDGLLRSNRSRGLDHDTKNAFDAGAIVLPAQSDGHTWSSLRQQRPILFCYEPDDGDRFVTYSDSGLEAIALPNPQYPAPILTHEFQKFPGMYWLSLPLFVGTRPFGTVIVECDSQIKPDVFETMTVLAARISELLLAREIATREAVETSMALMAHNLGSRLASLPLVLERYRLVETRDRTLREINDDFAFIVEHSVATVGRARELLSGIVVRRSEFDIGAMIAKVLRSELDSVQYRVECQEPVLVDADLHLLESVFVELVQNSRQSGAKSSDLFVNVKVTCDAPRAWVTIEYEDNGPGVPHQYKRRIFEEFFSRRPGLKSGTGLGLSYARRACEAHGGLIRENGVPGEGARFSIELPVRRQLEQT